MDEKKRTAFKEKCAANGRKSWAMRSTTESVEAERRARSERSKRLAA